MECACGPCIGMGQSPATDAVSLRTFNRNFYGRSGTPSASVYLVSPETAAASAVAGVFTSPLNLEQSRLEALGIPMPEAFEINDNMVIPPAEEGEEVEVVRGPNIKPFPINKAMPEEIFGEVLLKMEDNITTCLLYTSWPIENHSEWEENFPHFGSYKIILPEVKGLVHINIGILIYALKHGVIPF